MKDIIEMIAEGLEPASDEEIEKARAETLEQLKRDEDADQPWEDIEAQHQPGAPGFHSAMSSVDDLFDRYRAAYRAYEALGDTFQELASIALERAMGELDEEKGGEEGPRRS